MAAQMLKLEPQSAILEERSARLVGSASLRGELRDFDVLCLSSSSVLTLPRELPYTTFGARRR